jgi:hypothetical protein
MTDVMPNTLTPSTMKTSDILRLTANRRALIDELFPIEEQAAWTPDDPTEDVVARRDLINNTATALVDELDSRVPIPGA